MLSWTSTLVMNRAEEVQLFRRSREVTLFRSTPSNSETTNNDDLVLSVLKAPVKSTSVGVTVSSEDDDNSEDPTKRMLKHVRLFHFVTVSIIDILIITINVWVAKRKVLNSSILMIDENKDF